MKKRFIPLLALLLSLCKNRLCSMLNSSMFTHTQAITPRKDSKSKVIVYLERKCLFGEETYRHICYTEMRLAGANTKANRRTK